MRMQCHLKKKLSIKRFRETNDFKSILNEINILINKIRTECINLDYIDIKYRLHNNNIEIRYNSELNALLNTLNEILYGLYDNNDIMDKIFQDGYRDLFLNIDLHHQNKIDINNGLPNFMKNLGLGKKIYKKLIKDFNYITSFYGYNPSIDSNMVWDTILSDENIFSFTNDDNIISFDKDYSFGDIVRELKIFFKIKGNKVFDDDFLKKYHLTDDQLKILLNL